MNWEPGILIPTGDKPKGRHWRTYRTLHERHDAHVVCALQGMAAKFGLLRDRMGGG